MVKGNTEVYKERFKLKKILTIKPSVFYTTTPPPLTKVNRLKENKFQGNFSIFFCVLKKSRQVSLMPRFDQKDTQIQSVI